MCFLFLRWGPQHRRCLIKKTVVLLYFYDMGSKKHSFYCVFLLLGSGCHTKPIKPLVFRHFLHMGFVSGIWNLRPPAKVAKTMCFTAFFAHGINKLLVFMAFLQHWSGANTKTIMFTVLLEPWIKKAWVFIRFEQLWSGGNAKTIGFSVFFALPPDHCCWNH